tara:strand:+ start:132 stop:422 length:291 start_codon:yes stop_codon:yes gene_type:complete
LSECGVFDGLRVVFVGKYETWKEELEAEFRDEFQSLAGLDLLNSKITTSIKHCNLFPNRRAKAPGVRILSPPSLFLSGVDDLPPCMCGILRETCLS